MSILDSDGYEQLRRYYKVDFDDAFKPPIDEPTSPYPPKPLYPPIPIPTPPLGICITYYILTRKQGSASDFATLIPFS